MKKVFIRRIRNMLNSVSKYGSAATELYQRDSHVQEELRSRGLDSLAFFQRKKPTSARYPYEVHYPSTLSNLPDGIHEFSLVGSNWLKKPDLPYALAFGFNGWKYGFVADYCKDVRVAFASRKFLGVRAYFAAIKMKPRPHCIYVWGYTDPKWLARFAKSHDIPLIRVEDGFLRSAELGAAHTTPYSLIFDSKGLYYNASEPSDLSDILMQHPFATDERLMQDAKSALKLLVDNELSKYNFPNMQTTPKTLRVKMARRVLVIGQVDNDAAIRMGNPQGWRMRDIIRLARLENPAAEIIYRPHPEVYRGFQKTRFKAEHVGGIVEVVSPDSPLMDILGTVDQVYTISSLSGLEALIRGVKVTTLGTPFYSGWGATDDRATEYKGRTLSPLEIFAGAYLLYPRYLAGGDDVISSVRSTVFRIVGDRELIRIRQGNENPELSDDLLLWILSSEPKAFSQPEVARVARYLAVDGRPIAQRFVATIFASRLEVGDVSTPLGNILGRLSSKNLNPIISDLVFSRPDLVSKHTLYQVASAQKEIRFTLDAYHSIRALAPQQIPDSFTAAEEDDKSDCATENQARETHLSNARSALKLGFFESSIQECMRFTLLGGDAKRALEILAAVALRRFDYASAAALARVQLMSDGAKASWAWSTIFQSAPKLSKKDLLVTSAMHASIKPSNIQSNVGLFKDLGLFDVFGIKPEDVARTVNLVHEHSPAYVQSLLEAGKFEEAVSAAEALVRDQSNYRSAVALSKTLCHVHQYEEAGSLMQAALSFEREALVYDQYIKVCIYIGDYVKALALLEDALLFGVELGDTLPRKIFFAVGKIKEAFETFRNIDVSRTLAVSYSSKSLSANNFVYKGNSILLLPAYGPGDEIRFACAYGKFGSLLPHPEIVIGVEPRLHDLFARSFTGAKFKLLPVKRVLRDLAPNLLEYNKLPSSSLMASMDNAAAACADNVDQVALTTDVLPDIFISRSSIPNEPFLVADEARGRFFKEQLPQGKVLCGLNWRSSVTLQSRSEHYLSVEDLVPIFERTNFQFVNLQYDECAQELAWIEKRFPGRLLNFADLDQYNDLDGVAALISVLDLVIAPCTTVAELSGALGKRTLMLANSSELTWRRNAEDGSDVWHKTMSHVRGDSYRDKASLISAVCSTIDLYENHTVAAAKG